MKRSQRGGSLLGNIVKCGLNMGTKTLFKKGLSAGSKVLGPNIGKKLVDEGLKTCS